MHRENTEEQRFLLYIFPALILAVFLIGYQAVFQKLFFRWGGGDNSYCYLIVPLFIYLLWDLRRSKDYGLRIKDPSSLFELRRGKQRADDRGQRSEAGLLEDQKVRKSEGEKEANGRECGFRFGEFSWSAWGLIPIVLSVLLIIVGEIGSVETLLYAGLWGCVAGTIFILYGLRSRHLIFPLFILFFIVPLPPFVNRILTFNLKLSASKLSVLMLQMTGVSVLQEGNIIDLGISQLQVADACSGLRYLMPMLLTALLVGYFFNKKLWQKIVLVLMVVPLSIFVNAVRIWITGMLTVNGYEKLAQSFFHDFSGWLIYMIAGAFLVVAALVLKRLSKDQGSRIKDQSSRLKAKSSKLYSSNQLNQLNKSNHLNDHNDPNDLNEHNDPNDPNDLDNPNNSTNLTNLTNTTNITNKTNKTNPTVWPKPILITITLCLLFAVSGWALKEIPSAGNLPQRTTFDSFPMQIGQWQGDRHYIPKEILDQLWADDYVSATFSKANSANQINLLIPFYQYQGTRHTAHAPQSCMLGAGWALFNSKDQTINLNPHGAIKIKTMTWQRDDYKLLGSYFFFQRGRVITSPWMNKFYLMWDAFTKRRTDGALVRVEMTVASGQPMDHAYKVLEGFIAELWPILPKYVPE